MSDSEIVAIIIDDNEDIVELMEMEMDMVGIKVYKAYSGNSGFEVIKNNPDIKFILSDTNMPDGDGYELLKMVKDLQKDRDIFFYFITGDLDIQNSNMEEMGADGLFTKPFDFEDIVDILKEKLKT